MRGIEKFVAWHKASCSWASSVEQRQINEYTGRDKEPEALPKAKRILDRLWYVAENLEIPNEIGVHGLHVFVISIQGKIVNSEEI